MRDNSSPIGFGNAEEELAIEVRLQEHGAAYLQTTGDCSKLLNGGCLNAKTLQEGHRANQYGS
jgi:hypothetical protein